MVIRKASQQTKNVIPYGLQQHNNHIGFHYCEPKTGIRNLRLSEHWNWTNLKIGLVVESEFSINSNNTTCLVLTVEAGGGGGVTARGTFSWHTFGYQSSIGRMPVHIWVLLMTACITLSTFSTLYINLFIGTRSFWLKEGSTLTCGWNSSRPPTRTRPPTQKPKTDVLRNSNPHHPLQDTGITKSQTLHAERILGIVSFVLLSEANFM